MKNIYFKKQKCCVKDIPIGECFVYGNELFMVTDRLTDPNKDIICRNGDIICVNLSNGMIPNTTYIGWETLVTPVNINIDVL